MLAKIAVLSQAYKLNFWQHVAFEVAARHLLFEYLRDIDDELQDPIFPSDFTAEPYALKPQVVMYLGGEAGTGKSRVIHALLKFAKRWGRAGTVETMAFTGVAAINIRGKTMHSSRNLTLSGRQSSTPANLEMKTRYQQVKLVIIDEVSMTDEGLLGNTDLASRSMSRSPEKVMGRKHLMLGGDCLQLPPVRGSPCTLYR